MTDRPIVVGVAGGSGSGKTTVVQEIMRSLARSRVTLLHHDSYYRDYGHLPLDEREKINFDHPDSLETSLMVKHLAELLDGKSVEVPVYDFTTHTRSGKCEVAEPARIIIVDGILVLADLALRDLMDIKIYVDTDADVRFIRRLHRDISERGRTLDSVVNQYTSSVRPMHLDFVEPSKRYADVIVPEGGRNKVAIDMLVTMLSAVLEESAPD